MGVKPNSQVVVSLQGGKVVIEPVAMTLEEAFGSVKPITRPENFKALRKLPWRRKQRRLSVKCTANYMRFVDANIILRYLTNDDPVKARKCLALFRKAKTSEIVLTTSESVIAEVVYVLSSKRVYNLARKEVVARLRPLIYVPGLKLSYRTAYLRALEIYTSYRIDFEDALSIAHMERQKIRDIYSYDKDFDQVKEITRIEP
jgi:predicted nucleic acid-binding protein